MLTKMQLIGTPLRTAALSFALCLSCCSRHEKGTPPSLSMADSVSFEYAVYVLPTAEAQDFEKLMNEAVSKFPGLKLVEQLPDKPQASMLHAYVKEDVTKNYAPPDLQSLAYCAHGVTKQQEQALQHSQSALILDFAHPKRNVWSALHAADQFVEDLARKSGGLVWDEQTREIYSPDAWHQKRLESWSGDIPDVSGQTVIHIYSNGEFARAITLGMSKMGLPDVVVQEVPWSSENQVGNLINIFSQSIAERPIPHSSEQYRLDLRAIKNSRLREGQLKGLGANGAGVACLTLREGKWEDGDPKNRLVRLAPDRYPGDDPHAQQDRMISSFFGWQDSLAKIEHNEELLAESAKERSKLPALRNAFNAGLQPGEFVEVKAPFAAENGNTEWMWVEVTNWNGDQIRGTLQNEPVEVTSLRAGQVVQVREQDIFDFIHQFADKHQEGNTTAEIIRKMSEAKGQGGAAAFPVPACDSD